jgi:hypothetical protein
MDRPKSSAAPRFRPEKSRKREGPAVACSAALQLGCSDV